MLSHQVAQYVDIGGVGQRTMRFIICFDEIAQPFGQTSQRVILVITDGVEQFIQRFYLGIVLVVAGRLCQQRGDVSPVRGSLVKDGVHVSLLPFAPVILFVIQDVADAYPFGPVMNDCDQPDLAQPPTSQPSTGRLSSFCHIEPSLNDSLLVKHRSQIDWT